jgi:hypothetical protein
MLSKEYINHASNKGIHTQPDRSDCPAQAGRNTSLGYAPIQPSGACLPPGSGHEPARLTCWGFISSDVWICAENEEMAHVGTLDIDIALDAAALKDDDEYKALIEILMENGYAQRTELKKFQLVRTVDPKDGGAAAATLMPLIEPSAPMSSQPSASMRTTRPYR